jgi:hypothetical protein
MTLKIFPCLVMMMAMALAMATSSWAMENHTNVLRDQYGRAITGATVTVRNAGTGVLATIFSDNGITSKGNPFLTNALDGSYSFYAANGSYDITFAYPGVAFDPSLTAGIALFDINEFSGGGGGGGVTGWPTVNVADGVTWANALATALKVGKDTSNYWALYHDATDGLQLIGVCAGVANGCNYVRKLASGKYVEWLNSVGVSIGRLTETTGAWTNFTLDTEGSGNVVTMQEEAWWDVVACQDSTASHIWNTITGTSPAAACDTGSNTQKGYASFDAATDEAIQMDWVLPTGFTGAIDVHFVWKAAATSGAVGWCAQLIRVADGSTSDPAFPAQASGNCVSDTAKGTTLQVLPVLHVWRVIMSMFGCRVMLTGEP